jgi:hypothetical protein
MKADGPDIESDRKNLSTCHRQGGDPKPFRRIGRQIGSLILIFSVFTLLYTCDKFDFYGELKGEQTEPEASPLELIPELAIVSLNSEAQFQASGGVAPYTYKMFTGSGSVNSVTGLYKAPDAASNDVVRVTDSEGTTDLSVVRALAPLVITPGSTSMALTDPDITFTASGGDSTQPYTFTIVSGPGTIAPTGPDTAYYHPVAPGDAVIQVEDSLGSIKEATVTITPPGALRIDPTEETIQVGTGSVNFTAYDGTPPHNFFKDSGAGTLTPTEPSKARYDAPVSPERAVIRVTDNHVPPNEVTATVYVVVAAPVAISPTSVTINEGESFTFSASGGQPPYTFEVIQGDGTVDPVTGYYTAVKKGTDKVKVTDYLGSDDIATVKVKK